MIPLSETLSELINAEVVMGSDRSEFDCSMAMDEFGSASPASKLVVGTITLDSASVVKGEPSEVWVAALSSVMTGEPDPTTSVTGVVAKRSESTSSTDVVNAELKTIENSSVEGKAVDNVELGEISLARVVGDTSITPMLVVPARSV